MKNLFILFCFVLSSNVFANNAIFVAAGAVPMYGSGEEDATSSLLGTGISLSGGLRIGSIAFEAGLKRLTVTNDEIGDDKFSTEIKNSIFFGGARLFFDQIFSLKAGLASHKVEMDIYQGPVHKKSEEEDGEYIGIYGGMGIVSPMNKVTDLYFESTLYPVPDIGIYFIDIEIGVRFYL